MSSRTRVRRPWPLLAVRVVVALLAAMAVAQAVLAGMFLDGDTATLDIHMMIGMAMVAVALALTVFAGIAAASGTPPRMLIVGIVLTAALAFQVYAGMSGMVGVHVPLGIFLVTGIAMQTLFAFTTPLPGRQRLSDGAPSTSARA